MEKFKELEKMLGDLILSQKNDREDMKELRESLRESQRAFSKRQEKTDEQIRELKESQRKTDEQFREMSRELRESQRAFFKRQEKTEEYLRETNRQIRESQRKTEEQFQKTDVRLDNLNKKMEAFFGNYGEATEEFFYRSLEDEMRLGGIKFDRIERRVRMSERHSEFDVVLFNGECIGIVEVKSKAHPTEVKELADRKIRQFKKDRPEFSEHKFYFGIASMVTNPALIERAKEEGVFLLTQKGDHVEVVNSEVRTF